ncbi:hypothetical protein [Nocardia sp. NRRL S-836]|uniref:hypothetical protein n=1 Tax=Nocardia sp. NRRL S-836 TaxID=1519492 RepID=UPI0018D1D93A|nr:hypothetical protein [Nocardia sp. NRRL S-836]
MRLLRARRSAPRLVHRLGFAVLTLHNTFGDTLVVKGWRRRNPDATGNAYLQAVRYTAKRPLPLLHAALAPVAWFPALAAALISSSVG